MTLYAYTRELAGLTGALKLSASGADYSLVEPCEQLALLILRTERGTCLADLTFGVPWADVERAPQSMQASGLRAIQSGFAPFEQAGRITLLAARVEEGPLGRLLVEVDIADPRKPTQQKRTVRSEVPT